MRVLILHDPVADGARPDELDTLAQVEAVSAALARLGHDVLARPFDADLGALRRALDALGADAVFNLVESVLGEGRLIHVAPALYETLGIPFTGAGFHAMALASSKLATKERLVREGLPTPPWHTPASLAERGAEPLEAERWILKSVWEHGSLGIEADALVSTRDPRALAAALAARRPALRGEALAEAYVHGRELNVALLEDAGGPRCLPVPEIVFEGLPEGAPRVVGYRAKWDPDSPEWHATPRRFGTLAPELERELCALALACWHACGLAGAARVDLRLDERGRPTVIDVNVNPCLSPDAGFAAALERAAIPYARALERLLEAALARSARARA